ncbi:MAG TPA: acyl-CoA thioesterase [Thermomicrobiales bacterium]|nr:acyl-CoA thioesterase [Thermomicrobiales bacterium]
MTNDSPNGNDVASAPARSIAMRWRDLDAYGHVNNAVYQTYLEEARDAAIKRILRGANDRFEHVLARVAIDFRRELTLADSPLRVECGVVLFGNSSLRTRETIRAANGAVAAEAEAVVVAIDRTTRRPRSLTAAERSALRAAGAMSRESNPSARDETAAGEKCAR